MPSGEFWRRRALLQAGAAGLGSAVFSLVPGYAWAGEDVPEIVVPLAMGVAQRTIEKDGKPALEPVVARAFVDEQLQQANTIFGDWKIRFVEAEKSRALDAKHARLESRADRDALAASMLAGVINVFFVESLRDVDDPKGFRMGVTWRKLSNLKKKYVIVAASAKKSTMAHELGHFLGNDHSSVKNNLMSYDRDGGKVFLDATQGAKARRTASALLASKQLTAP